MIRAVPTARFVEHLFCVHGFWFSLRADHSDVRDLFFRLYCQFRRSHATKPPTDAILEYKGDRFHWRIGERASASSDLRKALIGLEAALCEAIIRSQQCSVSIHAATLYAGSSAALIVGPSGAGKSTLSVLLSQRGLTVASDDVVLIHRTALRVLPIPRCFHLDNNSVRLLEEEGVELPQAWKCWSFIGPRDLHQKPIPKCRVGTLIYMRGPRAEHPELKPISQAEMTARLLSETGRGPLCDAETVRVLSRISSGASCFTLVPGSLGQTAEALSLLVLRHENKVTSQREYGLAGSTSSPW